MNNDTLISKMVENVQCPVCTLFLHAGMSLSDHLETHPKEQVIKALVQMTVSGGTSGMASGALKAVLSGETRTEEQNITNASKKENDMSRSNSRLSTISSSSTLCSTSSSLNFATTFSTQSTALHQENGDVKALPNLSNETRPNNLANNIYEQNVSNANELYQNQIDVSNDTHISYNANKAMNFSRYHYQQQKEQSHSNEQKLQIQPDHIVSSQLENAQEPHQSLPFSKQNSNMQQLHLQESRTTATQSIQPLPAHRHQNQQSQQQQSSSHHVLQPRAESLISTTSAITFPTTQHPMYTSVGQRQHNMQLEQQNIKNMYSGGTVLPPPPPLQLFSYQQSTQHQKPPPAYGTAISQIRSQQNQNKQHTPTASCFPFAQTLHSHMQRHSTNNPPRVMSHTSSESTTTSTASTLTCTPIPSLLTGKHIGQDSTSSADSAYANNHKTTNDVLKIQQHSAHQHQNSQHNVLNTKGSKSVNKAESTEKLPPASPPIQNLLNSKTTVAATNSISSVSVTYSSPAQTTHQSNSPFTSLLAAPSPSSVLRYAESPVAHYLERDDGDFIVQETPKHIVECVEEEDGEFSVIERFHQSPPSVLHIHDDKNDEGIEEDSQPNQLERKNSSTSNVGNGISKRRTLKKCHSDYIDYNDDHEFVSTKNDDNKEDHEHISVCKKKNIPSNLNSSYLEPGSSSTSSSNTFNLASKKSSKNSITVLSDVQLNLNEYLDLVGNIIASSKIGRRRSICTSSAPIPLVKVEKIELPDDEYDSALTDDNLANTTVDSIPINTNGNIGVSKEALTLRESPLPLPSSTQLTKAANKYETEQHLVEYSCSKYENKNHLKSEDILSNERANDKSKSYGKSLMTSITGSSSHVTSVIRMATTSTTITSTEVNQFQYQEQHQKSVELHHDKSHHHRNSTVSSNGNVLLSDANVMAQDLSQPQKLCKISNETEPVIKQDTYCSGLPPPPPLRKGPKKLVIKPKSTKTEENAKNLDSNDLNINEMPTTSRLSRSNIDTSLSESSILSQSQDVIIKFEPSSYEIHCSNADKSQSQKPPFENEERNVQLQGHEKKTNNIKCKTENTLQADDDPKNSFTQSQCSISNEALDYRPIKSEGVQSDNETKRDRTAEKDSATEDARVLLDFANSSKCSVGNITTSKEANIFSSHSLFSSCSSSKILENSISKTNTSTNGHPVNSSIESSLRCEDEFIAVDEHELHEIISSSYSHSAVNGSLKEENKIHTQMQAQVEQQPQQQSQSSFSECPFSFFYNNGSGTDSLPRISSANQFSSMYHQIPEATTAATVASSSTLDTLDDSLSAPVESSSLHNRFGSVQGALPQWYQSATLVANSDFESALSIDNAAVDGDVGKYLDLDACKRENSCSDVRMAPSSTSSSFAVATDNSLAGGCVNETLNIRTDEKMPPKGEISEQESNCDIENSWSQSAYEEIPTKFYRTSFPGIFPQDNGWNHNEFFTVQDLSHSNSAAPSGNNNGKSIKSFDFHLPLEATQTSFVNSNLQILHDDVFPSTSLGIKKKRKRVSTDCASKPELNRSKPTATITSQQFLPNAQTTIANFNQTSETHQYSKPTTSSAAMMTGSSTTPSTSQTKPRKKVYKCPHCSTEFSKLRERNSHMIDSHNYVRQNRRLISSQATILGQNVSTNSNNTDTSIISASQTLLTFRSNATSSANMSSRLDDFLLDSKHNIKVEMEFEQHTTTQINSQNTLPSAIALHEGVHTKAELMEEKETLTAIANVNNVGVVSGLSEDKKVPLNKTQTLTAPTTKLATLYRMLVSYNVSTLKQHQHLTEFEEKLIESSIFFCYTCRTNFSSVKLYDAHLTEHPAECFTCGKKFQRWKNFSLHLKRHLGWKEFACTVCDKRFVVRSALVEHTRMHTGHTPLKCKVCGKSFKRYSNLTQHRKRHGRVHVRKKEYVCHCGEVLPSKARFLWHKETHDSKPKCCPHCCDRFVHANSLRRHIRLAHSDKFDYAEPMECPMCKQVFAKSSIKAHMATHSMDTQHDCKICNKSFSTKWNLKIHLWVHANRTAKPFKCEHCPKAFVREVDFKNHMNAHKQIKPYTCEYCGCKFIRKYNYMRHRREHHGNKKFTCELCKKSFHRHYYLIEHRRIHTGERPFQCTICGKSSTTKTNHNKHLKIHHSRDPFTVET